MTEPERALLRLRLPPLDAIPPRVPARDRRTRAGADMPRLGRLAACLVALALPVIGIAAADTVHRVANPRTMQAAASGSPTRGAAALLLTRDRDARR